MIKKVITRNQIILIGLILLIIMIISPFSVQDVANLVQIITGIATMLIIFLALWYGGEIREAIKMRHLDGLRYVKDLVGTEEASESRRWIYQELRKASWPLSPEEEQRLRAICRDFDHIGFLCRKELLPTELVAKTYHRSILDTWNRLERFIYKFREESSNENLYWEFEWLTHKADGARKSIEKDAEFFRAYNRRIA